MGQILRITGDWTCDPTGNAIIQADTIINGNLTVTGTTTTVNTTNLDIADATITLNDGEGGAGITAGFAGINIDRGSENDVGIRYNETNDEWELTNDGTTWSAITFAAFSGFLNNIVEDLSPEFGANMNVNGFELVSTGGGDIIIHPDTTGQTIIQSEVRLEDQAGDPGSVASNNMFYAKSPADGGSGLFFVNTVASGELASRARAKKFGLIY